jgi:hypothetical protein
MQKMCRSQTGGPARARHNTQERPSVKRGSPDSSGKATLHSSGMLPPLQPFRAQGERE